MFAKPFTWIKQEGLPEVEYTGIVVDNKDPLQIGRVKVMISIFKGIDTADLPWVTQKSPSFLGGGLGSSFFAVPEEGSKIQVFFERREIYNGYYMATLSNKVTMVEDFKEDYPNSYGFKDSQGNILIINKLTNCITLKQKSGTQLRLDSDESIRLEFNSGSVVKIDKDDNAFIEHSSGSFIKIKQDSDIHEKAPNILLEGNVTVSSGTLVMNAGDGGTKIDSTQVTITGDTTIDGNITSPQAANWDEAYSWGDHSSGGYLTSESEFNSSPASSISIGDIANWSTAYSWGDHSSGGYLTSESDPIFTAWNKSSGISISSSQVSDLSATITNNLNVAANTAARHSHSNLTTLNNTSASFTTTLETKLNNIEDNADVTDSVNVAASGAIMDSDFNSNGIMYRSGLGMYTVISGGSGGGLDADTLDGQHGSYYASKSYTDGLLDGTTDFTKLDIDNVTIDANKISVTNVNGNLELEANGSGVIQNRSAIKTSNFIELNALLSKAKGELISSVLSLSGQSDYSDIRMLHIFDNQSGSVMTDKLGSGNDLTLSSASSISTTDVKGVINSDYFNSTRYWEAADSDSLSFGNGSVDSDMTIIVAGIPVGMSLGTNMLLGKWDASASYPAEYFLDIGYAARHFNFCKGDTSTGGILRKRETVDRAGDIGSFHVYAATSTGNTYAGIDLYVDGVKCTSVTDSSIGSYTAMENGGGTLGSYYKTSGVITTASIPNFRYSFVLIMSKKLTSREVRSISSLLLGISGSL